MAPTHCGSDPAKSTVIFSPSTTIFTWSLIGVSLKPSVSTKSVTAYSPSGIASIRLRLMRLV